jgi:hypothetical protein
VLSILLVLSASSALEAQQANNAILVGIVSDGTGALLPGATVTATHVATQTAVDILTDERGQYRTPPLRIGEYELAVQLDGFRKFVRRGVVLNIGDVRNVDVSLELGALAETVTVEATPPPLNTSDSTVGTVITNEQIAALPLNGRDYLQLASLSAGTGPASNQGVVIGGQSGAAVAFLLDGHDNNSQQISTSHSGQKEIVKPSVDAIQEFKVVTNSYSAEYGRSSSGVVSVSLKSGTNDLNGSLYEFFRDDSLNATNYFAATKPIDTRHQFGGAVGLPLVRNKTFFFGDAETGRIRRETTTLSTLPSAAARSGQFSRTIIDPLTRLSFPGNQIPASRMDAAALRILGYVPLAQTGAATNNFVYNTPSDQDHQTWDVRIDHVFSPSQNAYVRVSSSVSRTSRTRRCRLTAMATTSHPVPATSRTTRVWSLSTTRSGHALSSGRFGSATTTSTGTRSCRRRICVVWVFQASIRATPGFRRSRSPATARSACPTFPTATTPPISSCQVMCH